MRALALVLMALAASGCDGAVDVTSAEAPAAQMTLALDSVSLRRNGGKLINLRVTSPAGGTTLSLAGPVTGVRVYFTPAVLPEGQGQSMVSVNVDNDALPGRFTVRINAASSDGRVVASTSLRVEVPEPQPECPNCPFVVGGPNVVSGVVLQRSDSGIRPFPGATVAASINTAAYGYGKSAVANANGEYRLEKLENAKVLLMAWNSSYDQPCASTLDLNTRSATANIEIVHTGDAKADTNPEGPALMGVVYERTEAGRRPLAGVRLYFDVFMETIVATTTTDELGRYSMCRLPTFDTQVWLSKDGYALKEQPVKVSGVMQMDIEMKRQ